MLLDALLGTWSGRNGFRMMPLDAFVEAPASARSQGAAGSAMLTIAYTWSHPEDGPQDGQLVAWAGTDAATVAGVWADSWHQQPQPMALHGTREPDGALTLTGTYAEEWGWRILVRADGDSLELRMDNVVPASYATDTAPAGPYPVMRMLLQRA
jgi:hypothetical protein